MGKKSLFEFLAVMLTGLAMLLIVPVSPVQPPAVHGAEPLLVPMGSAASSAPASLGHGRGVANVGAPRVASRHILVQLHPRTDKVQFLANAKGQGLYRLGRVYGSNWLTMSIPQGAEPRQAAAAARMLQGVLRATPDPIVRINDFPPHDPMYKQDDDGDPSTKPCDPLWEVCDPLDLVDQWGLFQVEAEAGWGDQLGSPDVVIAILDSGIDLDHDDLGPDIWTNPLGVNIWTNPDETPDNGVDDDGNGFIDDIHGADFCGNNVGSLDDDSASQDANPDIPAGGTWVEDLSAWPWGIRFVGDPAVGDAVDNNFDWMIDMGVFHGTFVAGVAGAMTDNHNPETGEYEGMAGVCWNCKLMPVRLINAEGWAFGSDAASAIRYATDMGAHVINASWGIDVNSADPSAMEEIEVLAQAVDYAVSHGVIVVAAAGNSGTAGLHFPACMANTIAVGSSNWLDQRSEFSSFAAVGDVLDVIAPGELIWSTTVLSAYDTLIYGWEPGTDAYGQADGTSFSTPLVSGYVGLILSQNPGATLSQVREVIRSNAVDIIDPNGVGDSLVGYDPYSGFGRIRMVVPTLSPEQNQDPFADAGPDQEVSDKGKPGVETVTLDGSGSYDLDGSIVSYQWSEDGEQIATGERATVNMAVGSHTITLRVWDDDSASGESSEDQVTIDVLEKNGDRPDNGGGSVEPTDMGVYAMDWSARNNLDVTINIRRDSNDGDPGLDDGDEPVSEARVTFVLTHVSNNSWTLEGRTDKSGNFRVKLLQAPAGTYQGEVITLSHDIHSWDRTLDVENPDFFTK